MGWGVISSGGVDEHLLATGILFKLDNLKMSFMSREELHAIILL